MECATYRLRADGADLAVEVWSDGGRNHARLLVDGEEAACGDAGRMGRIDLRADSGAHVRVDWWWTGRTRRVALVESAHGLTPLAPPAGTRAARSYAFQQRHPGLFAARHVVTNLGGTLLAVFGVGALLRALLPNVDIGLDVDPPDWLRYLNPFFYLRPVFDFLRPVFEFVSSVFAWIGQWIPDLPWQYVFGFIAACLLAMSEYRRRRGRAREQDAASGGDGDMSVASTAGPASAVGIAHDAESGEFGQAPSEREALAEREAPADAETCGTADTGGGAGTAGSAETADIGERADTGDTPDTACVGKVADTGETGKAEVDPVRGGAPQSGRRAQAVVRDDGQGATRSAD